MTDLVIPGDLTGQSGAPFSAEVVLSASESVRRACGWHIAPVVTETLTLNSNGGPLLVLPSLKVVDITEVRDVSDDTPAIIEGWRWSADGLVSRENGCWPTGFRTVEVDIIHGHETCPPELFPVIADFSRRRVAQESIGGRSVSFVSSADSRLESTLADFRIRARP